MPNADAAMAAAEPEVQAPEKSSLELPSTSRRYSHVAPDSMPETVTAALEVIRSLLLVPVSLVRARVATDGAVVSMVMVKVSDVSEVLPALSTAIAVMFQSPSVRVPRVRSMVEPEAVPCTVTVFCPLFSAVTVTTSLSATEETVMVGVVSLVTLPLDTGEGEGWFAGCGAIKGKDKGG